MMSDQIRRYQIRSKMSSILSKHDELLTRRNSSFVWCIFIILILRIRGEDAPLELVSRIFPIIWQNTTCLCQAIKGGACSRLQSSKDCSHEQVPNYYQPSVTGAMWISSRSQAQDRDSYLYSSYKGGKLQNNFLLMLHRSYDEDSTSLSRQNEVLPRRGRVLRCRDGV